MTKAVLLNSGGIDSRVLAAMLDVNDWEVHSLFIDWNVRLRPKGGEAAKETADLYCASHTVLPYGADWAAWNEVVQKHTTNYATMTSTMLGLQYAACIDADWVFNGSRKEVSDDPDFVGKFNELVNSNTLQGNRVLSFPLWDMTGSDVSEKAASLGVDLTTTYSCSVYPPDMTCKSCRRRERHGL
jgi:7-cyano-7-deazaguanine synthase in queuosine biosynthesis